MNVLQASEVNIKSLRANNTWSKIPSNEVIEKTTLALRDNAFEVEVVNTGEEAKERILAFLPKKSEVMTMTSVTLDALGITSEINEGGKYDAVKPKLFAMDREKDALKMKKIGAAPEWAVGSVHAITQGGRVIVASNTGSQLGAYAYASAHVIWVVGAQKIVKDLDSAYERLNQYALPLEAIRANKAYGAPGSYPSKILIFNQEIVPGRIKIVLVKEELGF